jgi:ribosomal protein S18 acetylase RimI-like enzyme
MSYTIRRAVDADLPFLWQMLYYAAHVDEEGRPFEDVMTNPDLVPYLEGWGAHGDDLGFIANDSVTGSAAGAAWLRPMPDSWPLYRFVELGTPELAMAMRPDHTGHGGGQELLIHLLSGCRHLFPGICLSVRASNPAKRLYERVGFITVAEITNRVGGASFVMALDLRPITRR